MLDCVFLTLFNVIGKLVESNLAFLLVVFFAGVTNVPVLFCELI